MQQRTTLPCRANATDDEIAPLPLPIQIEPFSATGRQVASSHYLGIRYGMAVFQRAVEDADTDAWTGLEALYRRLVVTWLDQRGLDQRMDEGALTATFAQVWRGLTPAHLAERPTLVALLRYLKQRTLATLLAAPAGRAWAVPTAGAQRTEAATARAITSQPRITPTSVAAWREAAACLGDPVERLVIQLIDLVGLAPLAIATAYPWLFPDEQAVRRHYQRATSIVQRYPHERAASVASGRAAITLVSGAGPQQQGSRG